MIFTEAVKKNSLELKELSSINKVSLVDLFKEQLRSVALYKSTV